MKRYDGLKKVSRQSIPRIVALLLFVLCFAATSVFAGAVSDQADRDFEESLRQQASAREAYYTARIHSFNRIVLASASLFEIKDTLTNEDWQHFYDGMHLARDFPSLLGLGYLTSQGDSAVVTYIAPDSTENRKTLGRDMVIDPIGRSTMNAARDTGNPTMSAPVKLAQDEGTQTSSLGVLIYCPIYQTGADTSTVAARRGALSGYTYAVFRPDDLLRGYVDDGAMRDVHVSLHDTTSGESTQLFSSGQQSQSWRSKTVSRTTQIDVRTWRISTEGVSPALGQFYGPISIFVFGAIASGGMALIAYVTLLRRMTRVHEVYEKEVERTKDELLALTSHQLRTPASAVKQYVGMLTTGIVGELTPEQLQMAQKAYEANERQLQIINELLYVSKADAGELVIEPRAMDLTLVTRSVVDAFAGRAAEKDMTLVFAAKKPHMIHGDARYLQMAIENLVSNAIKYSYSGSRVTLALREDETMVRLSVKDQGVGIPQADVHRLFSKFDRIDNPLSYSEGGSGLGLFLARQLVVAHGGDIMVESTEGEGSTFTMILPKESDITSAVVEIRRPRK